MFHITVEHETRPDGGEGDNFVKTRLSTGDMNDVFISNAGSLMQALNPEQNMYDMTNEPYMSNVLDSFKKTVSLNGKVYGAPAGAAMGGGWFYNKKIYADLGLSVPKTWAELMDNNEKIKEAGIVPVIGTYKDSWTSQMILLADQYNVQAQTPTFADDFTAHKAEFAWNCPIEVRDPCNGASYRFLLSAERSILFATDTSGKVLETYRPFETEITEITEFINR